jgi:hypothetical protein
MVNRNGIIWVLIDTDTDRGACVTAQIQGWVGKLNAIYSLASLLGVDKKVLKNIEKYTHKTNGIAQYRNRIVHDPWMMGLESQLHYRLEISWTSDKKFTFEHKPHTFDDLTTIIKKLDAHSKQLWTLWEEIKADPSLKRAFYERHHKPSDDLPSPIPELGAGS